MKLKNGIVPELAKFLLDEKLAGKKSRMRTKFVRMLNESLKEFETFRMELITKHAKKDKKGEPLTDGSSYQLEDPELFNKEFSELLGEEFIVDETESKREILEHIKTILDNTEKEFQGQEAFQYDQWCEAFENLKYKDKVESPKK